MANEVKTTLSADAPQGSAVNVGTQSTAGNTQNSDSATASTSAANTSNTDEDDEFDGLSAKELKRLLAETQIGKKSLDSELAEIKGKLDERERKERSDLENYKADVEKLQIENKELKNALETTAIINAILANKKFQFHDATIVAQNLKHDGLTVDVKTGRVEGIESELARVAKEMDFLVVSSTKDDSKTKDQETGSNKQSQKVGSSGPTGFQPGQGGGSGNGVQEQRNSLLSKYPILANR
jgi:hypothetical protein